MKNLVFASQGMSLPGSRQTKSMECAACGETTVVQSSLDSPYCAHCGCSDTIVATTYPPETAAAIVDDTEYSALTCSGCGVHLVISDETASAMGGSLHCTVCGTGITYVKPETATTFDEEEDDEWESQEPIEFSKPTETVATANIMIVPAETASTIQLWARGNRVHAFAGNTHVAWASNSVLGEITQEQAALNALTKVINDNPDKCHALETAGFTLVKFETPVSEAVLAQVQREYTATAQEVASVSQAEQENRAAALKQSVSIAIAGLDRGFFGAKGLMDAVSRALQTGSTHEQVLAKISEFLPDYQINVMEVASTLVGKPDDVRNELARAVEEATVRVDVKPDITDVLTKLPVVSTQKETANFGGSKVRELAARSTILGNRR